MKLSPREALIFTATQHCANTSAAQIAAACKVRTHVVRYTLNKLLDTGIISRYVFFDLHRIGQSEFGLYLSLSSTPAKTRQSFLNYFLDNKLVPFLIEAGGAYDYFISLSVESSAEVLQLLDDLGTQFGNIFRNKAICQRLTSIYFGRKYLAKQPRNILPFKTIPCRKSVSVDSVDRALITAMSEHPDYSIRQLGDVLHVAASTVEGRLRKLKQQHILIGYGFTLNLNALGIQTYRVFVYARGLQVALRDDLYKYSAKHPNICVFVECLGDWDFELVVEVSEVRQVFDLTQDMREVFGDRIERIELVPCFRRVKYSRYRL
jgi:DNA-binding Lrp family transcriptional regulator